MSSLERFPIQKKRDEFEDSGSAGKDVRRSREEIRQARDAKRNGEVIAAMPVEIENQYDPVAFFETAKQAYIELGKRVQSMGVEPKDIPIWEMADAALDRVKILSNEYASERMRGKKEEIAMLMEQSRMSLASGEVQDRIEDAAREIRNERKDREDQKIQKGSPREEAFGNLVSDTLQNIPDVQHEHDERIAELASVYGDTTPPEEVAKKYRELVDPKKRAAYLEYVRKAREGALQAETKVEVPEGNKDATAKEWKKLRELIKNFPTLDDAAAQVDHKETA